MYKSKLIRINLSHKFLIWKCKNLFILKEAEWSKLTPHPNDVPEVHYYNKYILSKLLLVA